MIRNERVYKEEELEGGGIPPTFFNEEEPIEQPPQAEPVQPTQPPTLDPAILQALSQPDGTFEPKPKDDIPEGFFTLREEDPPKVVSQQEQQVFQQNTPIDPNAVKQQPNQGNLPAKDVWGYIKEKINSVDPSWDYPQELKTGKLQDGRPLTNEQMNELLISTILEYADTGNNVAQSDDPFIREYIEAKQTPEFDVDNWINERTKKRTLLEQPSDIFMKNYLKLNYGKSDKNPNGWTDDKIEEYVDNMRNSGVLELEAMKYKREAQKALEYQSRLEQEDRQRQQKLQFEEYQKKRQESIEALINSKKAKKDIWGIEVGEAKKRQFEKDLTEMLRINPETGTHAIHDALMNDDVLYDVAYLLWLKDKGMRQYLSSLKEQVKNDVFQKTDLRPERTEGRVAMPLAIDPEKLKMPGY